MRSYRALPHTGDIRVSVMGDSLKELFTAGLEALSHVLKRGGCRDTKYTIVEEITLVSPDVTTLLVDFLSAVLTSSYEKKALFCTVDFKTFGETELLADISGIQVTSFSEDIKAVTYHEANVERNERGIYKTVIVLDI